MSADAYVEAFAARAGARDERPGLLGLLPTAERPVARLLVTDDRAHDVLAALVPGLREGSINVFARAERCTELLRGAAGWEPERTTALVHPDLRCIESPPLPGELRVAAVQRAGDDPPGVPLEDAAAAAIRADPRMDGPVEPFATYLRSLPPVTRLLAAVDAGGVVRATSGCVVTGTVASVLFVNTDEAWRGRGIGAAMTAAALRVARELGARHACLDATDAGLSIYERLGFAAVTQITRFSRREPR